MLTNGLSSALLFKRKPEKANKLPQPRGTIKNEEAQIFLEYNDYFLAYQDVPLIKILTY